MEAGQLRTGSVTPPPPRGWDGHGAAASRREGVPKIERRGARRAAWTPAAVGAPHGTIVGRPSGVPRFRESLSYETPCGGRDGPPAVHIGRGKTC